jgi:hypothetical protein
MQIVVFPLQFINALCSGLEIKLKLSLVILLTSLHRQSQTTMSEPNACQERFGRKISSGLPIMRFHRSKQLVLMKILMDRFTDDGKLGQGFTSAII